MVLLVLLKTKFGHAQISVPKIGKPMSKTACINPWWHRFKEQGKYHLSEQLWAGQMESTITWKKQSWKMHTLSKKALLGNKWTLLENKRAITGNKWAFLISGKRIHWLEEKITYNLTFHICSGYFWMFQT